MSIIQSTLAFTQAAATGAGAVGATSVAATLTSAPTAGNLLWAAMCVIGGTGETVTTPTGWTLEARVNETTSQSLLVFWRIAQAGDSATLTISYTPGAHSTLGLVEINGQSTGTWLNQSVTQDDAAALTQVTATITPTVGNCLILASFAAGAATGTYTANNGFAIEFNASGTNHCILLDLLQTSPVAVTGSLTIPSSHTAATHIAAIAPNVVPGPDPMANAIYKM